MRTKEAIEILQRRADYLAQRIVNADPLRPVPHRDRAEAAALKKAIDELTIRQKHRRNIEDFETERVS
jgi:hypothetical protein